MKWIARNIKKMLLGLAFLLTLILTFFGYQDIPIVELKEKYATKASSFQDVNGMNVHFRDEGNSADSIPIVLIHGTGSSLHTFEDWAIQLTKARRVIRMDLPAYGLTGPFPDRNYSIDNYVTFLKDFLTSIGVVKCVLGGNSLGGEIAWHFAVTHPEAVDKLILIDAAGYPDALKSLPMAFKLAQTPILKNMFRFITPRFVAKQSIENVFADKTKVSDALVDRYFELTLREGNRQAFVDRLNMQKDTTAYQKITSIKQPTLVLWGEEDNLIPVKSAYRFQEDLPNDTLVILKNVGHVPMEESPVESLESVLAFLKSPEKE